MRQREEGQDGQSLVSVAGSPPVASCDLGSNFGNGSSRSRRQKLSHGGCDLVRGLCYGEGLEDKSGWETKRGGPVTAKTFSLGGRGRPNKASSWGASSLNHWPQASPC